MASPQSSDSNAPALWFVVGSQHLYGPGPLAQVEQNARSVAAALDAASDLPVPVQFRGVLTTAAEITHLCRQASADDTCLGLIVWMHTFSPAKMWIAGLTSLQKPLLHLHTQFNDALPWSTIDMDFMNLNQAAHGDREFGFITARLRLSRKVVVGHWQDPQTLADIGTWSRAALGWHESQHLHVARFGDNMRNVAVTEGDKVEAQRVFGYTVSGFGIGDLTDRMAAIAETDVQHLVDEYRATYTIAPAHLQVESLAHAARIELGLRAFLTEGGFGAFTDTFEDLHGMPQLPGIAVQRLMQAGFGFAGEGDWKTAALVRTLKVMSAGRPGGTSFMEDYTYHLAGPTQEVLGSHMLEICPSIADGRPSLEVHPLGIGGKADPVRLVFTSGTGPATVSSVIDLGNRFRLIVNTVDLVPPQAEMPRLPVARCMWQPHPDLRTAAAAWIYAGGAHHTALSRSLTLEHLQDFAEIAGIELVPITPATNLPQLRRELTWSDAAFAHHR